MCVCNTTGTPFGGTAQSVYWWHFLLGLRGILLSSQNHILSPLKWKMSAEHELERLVEPKVCRLRPDLRNICLSCDSQVVQQRQVFWTFKDFPRRSINYKMRRHLMLPFPCMWKLLDFMEVHFCCFKCPKTTFSGAVKKISIRFFITFIFMYLFSSS